MKITAATALLALLSALGPAEAAWGQWKFYELTGPTKGVKALRAAAASTSGVLSLACDVEAPGTLHAIARTQHDITGKKDGITLFTKIDNASTESRRTTTVAMVQGESMAKFHPTSPMIQALKSGNTIWFRLSTDPDYSPDASLTLTGARRAINTLEKRCRTLEVAHAAGYSSGQTVGFRNGYASGKSDGVKESSDNSYRIGYIAGHAEGLKKNAVTSSQEGKSGVDPAAFIILSVLLMIFSSIVTAGYFWNKQNYSAKRRNLKTSKEV